jgi:hypothetical protein
MLSAIYIGTPLCLVRGYFSIPSGIKPLPDAVRHLSPDSFRPHNLTLLYGHDVSSDRDRPYDDGRDSKSDIKTIGA